MIDGRRISDSTSLSMLLAAIEGGQSSAAVSTALGRLPVSTYVYTYYPATNTLPPWLLSVASDTVLIGMGGIASLSQGAAYYAAAGNAPVKIGNVGANGYALSAALTVQAQARLAGPFAGRRWVLAGYSFGGGVVEVLAALLTAADPTIDVQVLTFGSPRPGDAGLAAALGGATVRRLFTPLDPIPHFPPTLLEAPIEVLAVGFPTAFQWSRYTQPAGGIQLEADGTLSSRPLPASALPLTGAILAAVASGLDAVLGSPHAMATYVSRMLLANAASGNAAAQLPSGLSEAPVALLTGESFAVSVAAALAAAKIPTLEGDSMAQIPTEYRPSVVRLGPHLYAVVWMGEPIIETTTRSASRAAAKWLFKFLRIMQGVDEGASLSEFQSSFAAYFTQATSPTGGFIPVLHAL